MLSCVGNYIQTYDETTQRTSLIWVKFSTYLNLPLKLDIPVTCKQDWHIFPSSKFILRLPTLLDILSTFLRLLKYKETSIKFSLESKTSVLILRPKDFIPPRAKQETPTNLHKNLGTFIQTYDETTQRTLLIWDKFSTYLNLPLKLDIPVTSKQDWLYILQVQNSSFDFQP